jgi:hypothetical protein
MNAPADRFILPAADRAANTGPAGIAKAAPAGRRSVWEPELQEGLLILSEKNGKDLFFA